MPRASRQALRRAKPLERKLLVLMSETQSVSNRIANIIPEIRAAEVDAGALNAMMTSAIEHVEEDAA